MAEKKPRLGILGGMGLPTGRCAPGGGPVPFDLLGRNQSARQAFFCLGQKNVRPHPGALGG